MKKKFILENTVNFNQLLIESLKDPIEASAYLQVALDEFQEDGDNEIFLMALRNIAEAKGGISYLSEITHLNRQGLYNTLSARGNPRLSTLGVVMKGLGFHLSVSPIQHSSSGSTPPHIT